jgi:hypothetical protein
MGIFDDLKQDAKKFGLILLALFVLIIFSFVARACS